MKFCQQKIAAFPKKFLAFLLFLFLSLIFITCEPSKVQESELYRFTDRLKEKNIIESPLKELIEKFDFVKEDLTEKWTHMPSLSNKKQDIWATSSRFPILGLENSEKPKGMKITRDRKVIGFIGDSKDRLEGWGWIQATRRKDLRNFPEFSGRRKFRGIVIRGGESFRMEEILPDGEVILEFNISQVCCNNYSPKLVVSLNKKPIEELILQKPTSLEIKNETKLGKYEVELRHMIPEGKSIIKKNNFILIDSIQIRTQKDIILLITAKKEDKTPPSEKYQASYYTLYSESLVSHHKSNNFNWLYESSCCSVLLNSLSTCKIETFSKAVTLKICKKV